MSRARRLAERLRSLARQRPDDVARYLSDHSQRWSDIAVSSPEDAADILEEIGDEAARELISDLAPAQTAELLEEVREEMAGELLTGLPDNTAIRILESMAAEHAADVLAAVDDAEADRLLKLMNDVSAEDVGELLAHHPESAGGLMTTNIAALPVGMTVGEAVDRIRGFHETLEDLSYVYVVDESGRLVGVVSFRDLVFRRPGDGLRDAMVTHPVSVTTSTDRELVAELVQRYHLFGLPVVDDQDVLVGMVPTDAVLVAVREEASEDFAIAVGTTGEDSVYVPLRSSIRHRLPWIVLDLGLSLVVVVSISSFDQTITAFVVLAALMPLVARIGGDAGAQTLAVVIRGISTDGIPGRQTRHVLTRETTIGLVNGLIVGLLAGVVGYSMQSLRGGPNPSGVALAMLLAAWANLAIAGLLGAAIPLALRRMRLDPALGSNLFLTTFTDLLGFVGFLTVATVLL